MFYLVEALWENDPDVVDPGLLNLCLRFSTSHFLNDFVGLDVPKSPALFWFWFAHRLNTSTAIAK